MVVELIVIEPVFVVEPDVVVIVSRPGDRPGAAGAAAASVTLVLTPPMVMVEVELVADDTAVALKNVLAGENRGAARDEIGHDTGRGRWAAPRLTGTPLINRPAPRSSPFARPPRIPIRASNVSGVVRSPTVARGRDADGVPRSRPGQSGERIVLAKGDDPDDTVAERTQGGRTH